MQILLQVDHPSDELNDVRVVFPSPGDKCQHEYLLGWNGTIDGCDECTGVRRDLAGHAWTRHERVAHYQEDDGSITKVSRRLAFAHRNPALRPLVSLNRILQLQGSFLAVIEQTDQRILIGRM